MTHVFALTDGTTTVNLNDGTAIWTLGYQLAAPEASSMDATDRLDLMILGVNTTAVQNTIRSVERLLVAAARRQTAQTGARVFLTAQLDGDAAAWRSEIYAGQLLAEKLSDQLWRGKIEAALLIQRAPFWEGAETEIPLSAPNQAAVTGGVTIYNHEDATAAHGNWVQIASDQVAGSLPAPIRLRLTNNSGTGQSVRTFHIAVNAFANPTTADITLEGEDDLTGTGADTYSTAASGNYFWTSNVYVTGNAVLLGQWLIPAATMAASAGRWWRLLARGFVAGTIWAVVYDYTGLGILWAGSPVTPPNPSGTTQQLIDLGVVPIPPGAYDAGYATVRLALWGRANPVIDFFQLFCVDAYRRVEIPASFLAFVIAQTDYLEIDEIESRAYMVNANGRHPYVSLQESPLFVFPGVTQRINVLVGMQYTVPIDFTQSVRVWYRPRRLTL